jgi:hypothetical protein
MEGRPPPRAPALGPLASVASASGLAFRSDSGQSRRVPTSRIGSLSDDDLRALEAASTCAIEETGGLLSLSQIGELIDPPLTQQRMTQLFALDDAPSPTAYVGKRGTPVYSYATVALWARHTVPRRTLFSETDEFVYAPPALEPSAPTTPAPAEVQPALLQPDRRTPQGVNADEPSGAAALAVGTEPVLFTQRIPADVKEAWDARLADLRAPRGVTLVVALRLALERSDDELETAIAEESYRQQKARVKRRDAARWR